MYMSKVCGYEGKQYAPITFGIYFYSYDKVPKASIEYTQNKEKRIRKQERKQYRS